MDANIGCATDLRGDKVPVDSHFARDGQHLEPLFSPLLATIHEPVFSDLLCQQRTGDSFALSTKCNLPSVVADKVASSAVTADGVLSVVIVECVSLGAPMNPADVYTLRLSLRSLTQPQLRDILNEWSSEFIL